MTPDRWQHVREILYGASKVEVPRRPIYLAERCGNDRVLRAEVEDLLAALDESSDFLEPPRIPERDLTGEGAPHSSKHTGRRVGAYQLLEKIGSGGMGEVYRAVRADGQFEQEVAVKLVRGGWDGGFIVERFRQERQVLAMLEHPNIARLLDGGTTEDGVPYLVMELIDGIRIDHYCCQHGLNVDSRLRLFNEVCAAVQYAHQRLVIHRDIKPGNILVTPGGVPKLLDFGIAKIVDPSEGTGATMLLPMTPEYASPEQIRGEPITTASDVYSLGVVLYLLITGHFPYRAGARNTAELARATTDREPERPSAAVFRGSEGADQTVPQSVPDGAPRKLSRRLLGDLDTIVLKALRKEPQHRYSSVEQLSEDLKREMQGLPVQARRGSWNYRAGKFLRRHKIGVVFAGLTMLAIMAGVTATTREARIAAANAQMAEKRFNDVRALATSNLFELNDAIEKLPESAAARHLLIQRSLEYLDKLRGENGDDRDLLRQIALGYERIAELQGRFTGTGVGDVNRSQASYRKALAIRARLTEISHQAPDEVVAEVRLLGAYTKGLLLAGDLQGALRSARTARRMSVQLVKSQPQDPQALLAYANANLMLGWTLGGNGSSPNTREFDEAIARDQDAIQAAAQLTSHGSKNHQAFFIPRLFLALHYWKSRSFDKTLETVNALLAQETAQSVGPVLILHAYNWRGNTFDRLGDRRRALKDYQQGLRLARSVAAAHPDDMEACLDQDILTGLSAIEEARLGAPRTSLKNLNDALTSIEHMFASNPELFYQRILIVGYSFRAEILSSLGDQASARDNLLRSLSIAENLENKEPSDLDARLQIARIHAALGVLWARSARFDIARMELSSSVTLAKQLLTSRPADGEAQELAGATESELWALAGCAGAGACGPMRRLRLPSLVE